MARGTEEIFDAALGKARGAERTAFLDGACGRDADLRSRVDALLEAHDEAGDFLQSPAVDGPSEGPGTRIGPYKLLQLIGEGGMGVVYMAEQLEPVRRKVALKIIKLGMDTKQVIARFEAERQAIALTNHPNIARVLDAGTTETGRPYFVMELVKGVSISTYCDRNNLTTQERLELFLPICSAIQHAHQRGIIHRDLKPANVLVTLHDGRPIPKVIDFGIAKAIHQRLTEKTLFTEYHQLIGTPEYMSPEQAEMSGLDVDTRTDIYSLGVLLYELLTGTTPFDPKTLRAAGYAEFQRIIREEDPQPMSTRVSTMDEEVAKHRRAEPTSLNRLLRGDLDWIVLKALEKDRTRRYETAASLADDIRRHLASEPVLAGAPSRLYRLRKFIRRNRVAVTAGSLAVAALLVGLTLAVAGLVKASREAAHSQAIAQYLKDVLVATDPDEVLGRNVDVDRIVAHAYDVFGDDDDTVAATLFSRALQLHSASQLDTAEALYRESLRIWTRRHGPDHPNVGIALSKIGSILMLRGDDRAEPALRESLRITDAFAEKDSLARATTMFELAIMLQDRREFEEAEQLMVEAIRIRRAATPHQKVQIAIMVNARANLLSLAGRGDELEPVLRETLAAWREAVPADSPLLAKALVQSAAFYLDRNDPDEAERLLRDALGIFRLRKDASVYYRDAGLSLLSRIVNLRDDDSKEYIARRLAFVQTVRDVTGERSAHVGRALTEYAAYMTDHGETATGIAMARESLEILGKDDRLLKVALGAVERAVAAVARARNEPAPLYEAALAAADQYAAKAEETCGVRAARCVLLLRLGREEQYRALRAELAADECALGEVEKILAEK